MYQLSDMALSDDEKLDMAMPISMPDAPEFPPGLRISLTEAEMEKLGLDVSEAKVGSYFLAHIYCCVTSVSQNSSDNGDCCRLEAQIEQMEVEGDDEPDEDDAPLTGAKALYKTM